MPSLSYYSCSFGMSGANYVCPRRYRDGRRIETAHGSNQTLNARLIASSLLTMGQFLKTDSSRDISSLSARCFARKPQAPKRKASCMMSISVSWVTNMILVAGTNDRMRRAASKPLSFGRPISIRIKSGSSSRAFATASSPSDASPIRRKCGCPSNVERTNSRNGAKSSTKRMRMIDVSKGVAAFLHVPQRFVPTSRDVCADSCRGFLKAHFTICQIRFFPLMMGQEG